MIDIIYTVLTLMLTFIFTLGIIYLCRVFLKSLTDFQSKIIIIPIGGHVEDIEMFILSLINRSCVSKLGMVENIIIADMGADDETSNICRKLEEKYEFVYFCEGKEISEKLQEKMFM